MESHLLYFCNFDGVFNNYRERLVLRRFHCNQRWRFKMFRRRVRNSTINSSYIIRYLFLLQAAFHILTFFNFMNEKRKSSTKKKIYYSIKYVVLLLLLVFSYVGLYHRVAVIVMFAYDISNVFKNSWSFFSKKKFLF
jgi:hypothetical protein